MNNEFWNAVQAASNTVAGNVSGPVDIIAWALRKAGVPVPENALMSSKWMEEQGLMKPVRQGVGQVIGDTAGLLAPIAAAAKAPQIAAAALKGGENLAAPRTLNPQTGAIVWHGSPHKFDKFDSSKIGTGEGAQAYGHGLYLADSQGVAKSYKDTLSQGKFTVDGKLSNNLDQNEFSLAARYLDNTDFKGMPPQEAIKELRDYAQNHVVKVQGNLDEIKKMFGKTVDAGEGWGELRNFTYDQQMLDEALAALDRAKALRETALKFSPTSVQKAEGSLYKVDLQDDKIAKMLDWDSAVDEAQRVPISQAALKDFGSGVSGTSGERIYREIVFEFKNAGHPNPERAATDWLRTNGVPGIKYLDGGSRSAGSGSRNYVAFPGEEDALKILERNGQGLLGP